mgnify:CR=1 FL=1
MAHDIHDLVMDLLPDFCLDLRIQVRKLLDGAHAEAAQELLGGREQGRSARCIETSDLIREAVLDETVDRMVRADATDTLDLRFRDRLLVGDDGKRF